MSKPQTFTDDASRWRAVVARDPAADGAFVYACISTHIYCRPTCSARLARRANVIFFNNPQQAVGAGFRACKRCKPELAKYDPLEAVLEKARSTIEEAIVQSSSDLSAGGPRPKITLKEIADRVNLTPRYLHKIFKERMGCTPKEYAESMLSMRDNAGPGSSGGNSASQTDSGYMTMNGHAGYPTPSATSDSHGYSDDDLFSVMDLVNWDYDPEDTEMLPPLMELEQPEILPTPTSAAGEDVWYANAVTPQSSVFDAGVDFLVPAFLYGAASQDFACLPTGS